MTSLDISHGMRSAVMRLREAWEWYDSIPPVRRIHRVLAQVPHAWRRMSHWLNGVMPKGLYARALLIIIAPMVILQSVIAFVFMERHWNLVTQRLSADVVHDIGALMDVYKLYPQDADRTIIRKVSQNRLGLARSRSFRCSTRSSPSNCGRRSKGRSGSTRSASRRSLKFAFSSTTP